MDGYRKYNAEYYDLDTRFKDDVEFYKKFVNPSLSVLELGCGTGRVTRPLSEHCNEVVGVDISMEMLNAAKANRSAANINYKLEDGVNMSLGRQFDLVIAPFRVLQALERNEEVQGFFKTIKEHLKPGGTAIVNAFNPLYSQEEMPNKWIKSGETTYEEQILDNGDILKVSDTRTKLDADNQVLYPVLIYRRYRKNELIDEYINPICMRYYYPEQLKKLIISQGFEITQAWGGYSDEMFGNGPELVVAFTH